MTHIDGVTFEEAWDDRFETVLGDQAVAVLSRPLLIRNKRRSGRDQDLVDAKWLEAHPEGDPSR